MARETSFSARIHMERQSDKNPMPITVDLFLISNDFKDIVPNCEIKHTTVSDHSSVNLQIESQDQKHKRGQGFWKFNNSLLKDEEFVNELRSAIPEKKKEYSYLDDKGLKWDLIKMSIRALTIKYSKRKARNKRNREISLFEELNVIQKDLESNPNISSLKLKLHNIKQELDEITDENTRSSVLRSKARLYERGERNSKYFCNLEKRNYSKKHITQLKTPDNQTITDPVTILNEEKYLNEHLYRSINDVMFHILKANKPGIAIFLDFRKAFDTIEWEFLFKALKTFNFRSDFISWVQTFYGAVQSCVINNGHSSQMFNIERGVRQGCPLSGLLFVLCIEILEQSVKQDSEVLGIQVKGKEIKICQYADDTTCFVRNKTSIDKLLMILDNFGKCSGLKINTEKTEAMWLGSL